MPVIHTSGANMAAVQEIGGARFLLPSSIWGGKVRVMCDQYTTTDAMDTGSTLRIARLPKGAVPIGMIFARVGAIGGFNSISAGDGISSDRFLRATLLSALDRFFLSVRAGVSGVPLEEPTDIAVNVLSDVMANRTLYSVVFYTLPT